MTQQAFREMPSTDVQSPAAAGTVTPNMLDASIIEIQMPAGNVTVASPLNAQPGQHLLLIVKQDGVGGRTITWGSAYKKNIALSAGANAIDCVAFVTRDGVTWYQKHSALTLA